MEFKKIVFNVDYSNFLQPEKFLVRYEYKILL